MTAIEAMQSRRSIRSYTSQPVIAPPSQRSLTVRDLRQLP